MISGPPRTVPWQLRVKWLRDRPNAFLFGVILVGMPLVMAFPQYWILTMMERQIVGGVDYVSLSRHGKDASGEVITVGVDPVPAFAGERPWTVKYRFVADGRERQAEMKTFDKHIVADWQEGHPLKVKYLGPESIIIDVKPYEFPLWKIWIINLCASVAVGLPFLLYAIAGMRMKVTLYRNGVLTTGSISAVDASTWLTFLPAFKFRFRVTYRFQDRDGKDVLGSSTSMNTALLNAAKQGDPIDVLFLESRPEINCLAEEHHLLALPDNA